MRVLLDTHALIWALRSDKRLSRPATEALELARETLVSPVSAYEICFKHRLGKLPEMNVFAGDLEKELGSVDVTWLPITPTHAVVAGKLDPSHRDPFDRLLIAQALVERVPLVSNEEVFDGFGVERIW